MPTIKDWIATHPISITVLAGPYESVSDEHWKHDAYRLRLVWLEHGDTRSTPEFAYRMGVGHRVKKFNRRTQMHEERALPAPEVADVLDSLISDAACYDEARSFEDFAGNLGYDTDSRKAEALYRECGEVLTWLEKFVGGRAVMEHLMYELERL